MASVGIRELKNSLSRYIRRVERGERITVTDRGRVVAELAPPRDYATTDAWPSRYAKLVAEGTIRLPVRRGNLVENWPVIRLPRGTAARLIDEDRDER